MASKLYSIRMRAATGDRHISGAERIAEAATVDQIVRELVMRAMGRTPAPEQIFVNVEYLGDQGLRTLPALDVITLDAPDVKTGRSAAVCVLQEAGVSRRAAEAALHHLTRGATMRGAIVMDAQSGERLEPDQQKGVRASRFDWSEEARAEIQRRLAAAGLTHFRTYEAIALATKVASAPGIVAELCWSDDPDYTAGYVASLKSDYVRLPTLKEVGDPKGGRAFFVNRETLNLETFLQYLQTEPVLIDRPGAYRAMTPRVEDCTDRMRSRRPESTKEK